MSSFDKIVDLENRIHGFLVRLKELHYSSPSMSIHTVIDDFHSDLAKFQDSVMEDAQSMVGFITPGTISPVLPKATEIEDLLIELKSSILDFYDSLESVPMWIGVKSEIEGFIHTICQTIYRIKICKGENA